MAPKKRTARINVGGYTPRKNDEYILNFSITTAACPYCDCSPCISSCSTRVTLLNAPIKPQLPSQERYLLRKRNHAEYKD